MPTPRATLSIILPRLSQARKDYGDLPCRVQGVELADVRVVLEGEDLHIEFLLGGEWERENVQ